MKKYRRLASLQSHAISCFTLISIYMFPKKDDLINNENKNPLGGAVFNFDNLLIFLLLRRFSSIKITVEKYTVFYIQTLRGRIRKKCFAIIPRSILTATIADFNPLQYIIIHLSGSTSLGLSEESSFQSLSLTLLYV